MSNSRWTSGGVKVEPQRFMLCDLVVLATTTAQSILQNLANILDVVDNTARAHANAARDRAEFKADTRATIDLL